MHESSERDRNIFRIVYRFKKKKKKNPIVRFPTSDVVDENFIGCGSLDNIH